MYERVELLGRGGSGEVWSARDPATGELVALKRLRRGEAVDPQSVEALRAEAARLARLDHPHVVRLRGVEQEAGSLVLVLDYAAGGSLAGLLSARGRLSAGEVVTVLVPLAEALACVHEQGLVHGDLTPANVLFTGDGRPLLADLGVASLLGAPNDAAYGTFGFLDPAGDRGPAGDVHGLAATGFAALTGQAPYDLAGRRRVDAEQAGRLLDLLERGLDPDPALRPSAGEFAAAAYAAAEVLPVRLAGPHLPPAIVPTHRVERPRPVPAPGPVPRPKQHRRRALPRLRLRAWLRRWVPRTGAAIAVAVALVASLVVGFTWTSRDTDVTSVGGPPTWHQVLAQLDHQRSSAFATGEAARLGAVYVAGSAPLTRDRAVLARLTAAGLRARGLRLLIQQVRVLSGPTRTSVRLQVVDRMSAYALVDATGKVVEQRPGRRAARWVVTLSRVGADWRIAEIARGATAAPSS